MILLSLLFFEIRILIDLAIDGQTQIYIRHTADIFQTRSIVHNIILMTNDNNTNNNNNCSNHICLSLQSGIHQPKTAVFSSYFAILIVCDMNRDENRSKIQFYKEMSYGERYQVDECRADQIHTNDIDIHTVLF